MRQLQIDLSRCDAGRTCGHACEQACATQVFKHGDPAGAALHVREVEGRPGAALCDQCGDCLVVCPSGALGRNRQGVIRLDPRLCVSCYVCVGFCEKGVFQRLPGRMEPYKCTACGVCVKACPNGALSVAEVPEPQLAIV
jgi:ferredoxin